MPTWLLYCLVAVNALAFLLFGYDKSLARRDQRRIPEAHLLLLMACGGLVGGWLAMSVFRHKTRKVSFRWKAVLASAVNALWVWLWFESR